MSTAGCLFSGLGGLDLATETLGFDVAWQVEADPWRRQVLATRWPEVVRYGDVKEVSACDLEPVDLVVAGPPCQPISNAGHRKAQADPRWLWEELARLLRDLRPRHVFLENPSALLGRGMGAVLGLLAACGYVGSWRCLRALDIGAPHARDRVWILARLADASRERDGWPRLGAVDGGQAAASIALWPTPKGSASHYGQPRPNDRGDLQAAVLWPTPTASNPNEFEDLDSWQARRDRELAKGRNGNGVGTPLGIAARLWATPRANDGGPDYAKADRYASDPRGSASPSLPTMAKGALNPPWVEALMGYPEGWTDPARSDVPHRLWPHQWPAPPDLEHGSPQHPWEPPRTVVARTIPVRAKRVSALGDSVVPQCAATALQMLWASQTARTPA